GERLSVERDECTIGQRIDGATTQPLGASAQALGVQHLVHLVRQGARAQLARPAPALGKRLCLLAAALEAGAMAGCERGWLIEKKQLGKEPAPDIPVAAFEIEDAADPSP